jgi:hypothetical protein
MVIFKYKSPNIINNPLNEVHVPDNVRFDTTIKRFGGLEPDICKICRQSPPFRKSEMVTILALKNGNISFHTQ